MKFNIWNDFPQKPLPELLDFIVDNRGKTVPTVSQEEACEIVLIATNCIRNENLYPVYEKVRYISKETYEKWFRAHPISGDIIFVNKGTPGRICFCPENIDFCIAQDMMAFRVNSSVLYNKYLLAVLRSREMQEQIRITSVGDTIPHFKKEFLKELTIPLPPMDVQQIIGDYYFKLSEKIELNKKINENLEQQAQAYFVDLFITNVDPNWRIGTISDLGNVVGGGTPSKKIKEYYTSDGIAWITPKDLSNDKSKFVAHGETDITELGLAKSSATLMPKCAVLFSSRAPIGYIAIADGQVCTNQGFKSIVPFDNVGTAFVYYFLKENLSAIENVASGSTFKEVSGSTMKNFTAIIPDNDTLAEFQRFCSPLFEQQRALEYENRYLSSIRDTFLPKLMNGEIDVSAVQI